MTPRTDPGRAARAAALLIAGLALTTGCRIPETGVVQAGEPATGVRAEAFVYLVLNGRPVPVFRPAEAAPVDEAGAVALVFRELTAGERQAGLTTRLPPLPEGGKAPRTEVSGDGISVELPFAKPLDGLAAVQLACTVADAHTVANPDEDEDAAPLTVTLVTGTTRSLLRPGLELCAEGPGAPEAVVTAPAEPERARPAPATAEPASPTAGAELPTAGAERPTDGPERPTAGPELGSAEPAAG
ncbi:hypothetical protein [Streptomyces sp. NPDC093109]|uniref:hypothetical protein n=1 Tax=Streptomyces sp. NPDC093109 TaxID=3154977 RepID=UPI00344D6DBC